MTSYGYRLSTRNQVRQRLRPLGFEAGRYQLEASRNRRRYAAAVAGGGTFSEADARVLFAERNITFCLTAGRTGTTFIAALLNLAPDVRCVHEPAPCFTWLKDRSSDAARNFWLQAKLPAIAQIDESCYVETSHAVGKGYVEPLLALGVQPTLLAIGRDPRRVATSYLEKYTVPGRTWLGRQWHLNPTDLANLLPLREPQNLSDYQLCFWYVLEMEQRQMDYLTNADTRDLQVIDVRATELHDFATYAELLRRLGVAGSIAELTSAHEVTCATVFNKTARRTLEFFGNQDDEEAEVWSLVAPHSPGLQGWVEARYQTASESSDQRELRS